MCQKNEQLSWDTTDKRTKSGLFMTVNFVNLSSLLARASRDGWQPRDALNGAPATDSFSKFGVMGLQLEILIRYGSAAVARAELEPPSPSPTRLNQPPKIKSFFDSLEAYIQKRRVADAAFFEGSDLGEPTKTEDRLLTREFINSLPEVRFWIQTLKCNRQWEDADTVRLITGLAQALRFTPNRSDHLAIKELLNEAKPRTKRETRLFILDLILPELWQFMSDPENENQTFEFASMVRGFMENRQLWDEEETVLFWSWLPHPFPPLKLSQMNSQSLLRVITTLCDEGFIHREHVRDLIGGPEAGILQNPEIMRLFVERGLWTREETDLSLARDLENFAGNSSGITRVKPLLRTHLDLWRSAGLWDGKGTKRLEEAAMTALWAFHTPAERCCASYIASILGADRRGLFPAGSFDADLFFLDLINALPLPPFGRYLAAKVHLPSSPPIIEPGDPLGKVAAITGGKWAGLERARELNIPVPDGFNFTVREKDYPEEEARARMARLEQRILGRGIQKTFGKGDYPLLVSVRSGAPVSLPGAMKTVLNVGVNDDVIKSLTRMYGQKAVLDIETRFIVSFATAVFEMDPELFSLDGLSPQEKRDQARALVREAGFIIPDDPWEQLSLAHHAVRKSWNDFVENKGELYGLSKEMNSFFGTAVSVNEMFFGNLEDGIGGESGAGTAYSRNRMTSGAPDYYYLRGKQGSDLMTPSPGSTLPLETDILNKRATAKLKTWMRLLESEFGAPVEIEFVIERGKLILTQVRVLQLAPQVAWLANERLLKEGIISEGQYERRLFSIPKEVSIVDIPPGISPVTQAVLASAMAASGQIVFTTAEAQRARSEGRNPVIVEISSTKILGLDISGNPWHEPTPDPLPGEGMIAIARGRAPHNFTVHTANRVALQVLAPSHLTALATNPGSVQIGAAVFLADDEITLASDGRVFPGKHPISRVPTRMAASNLRVANRAALRTKILSM